MEGFFFPFFKLLLALWLVNSVRSAAGRQFPLELRSLSIRDFFVLRAERRATPCGRARGTEGTLEMGLKGGWPGTVCALLLLVSEVRK